MFHLVFRNKHISQLFRTYAAFSFASTSFFLAKTQVLNPIFSLRRTANEQVTNFVDFNSDGLNALIVQACFYQTFLK
jgi:hypothetical protein